MKFWNARSRQWLIASHDIILCLIAWFAAFSVRHNFDPLSIKELEAIVTLLPVIALGQFLTFFYFKTYRSLWRFISVYELSHLIQSVCLTAIILQTAIYLFGYYPIIPRSIVPLYAMIAIALLCSGRFAVRFYRDRHNTREIEMNALIIGAGSAGESLLRDFLKRKESRYKIIAFLDDDPYKQGQSIHHVQVMGTVSKLESMVAKYDIKKVFIAIPSASSSTMRTILSYCHAVNISMSTLPSLSHIVDGKVTVDALKGVSIEDLLGRSENKLDLALVRSEIQGKTIFITGAGGSIGSELTRQIISFKPKVVILLDHAEYNLYQLQIEHRSSENTEIIFSLGSVCDELLLEGLFRIYSIDYVFHAAAYKHVPLLETQTRSAVMNNIFGTEQVARISAKYHIKKMILISTDKAVDPQNFMGATKRLAELICQYYNRSSKTIFTVVRFGNVLGSQGSVLPLFKSQLAKGGPLTVTDPKVTRYFMSIPEAASLILQSSFIGNSGEIYVLDMGEPISILYLAEQIIRLSGRKPYDDIGIEFIGLRPGEKMYETLFYQNETMLKTPHKKILISTEKTHDFKKLMVGILQLKKHYEKDEVIGMKKIVYELLKELNMSKTQQASKQTVEYS